MQITSLIKYNIDSFTPLNLFPFLNSKHPEGRNRLIHQDLPNSWHFMDAPYLLVRPRRTVHHLGFTEAQPMEGNPLNQRMLGQNRA